MGNNSGDSLVLIPEVVEMTKEGADLAHELYLEIIKKKELIAQNFLSLGKIFKVIRDMKLYKLLDYNSFGEFLGAPEIGFSYSSVRKYIYIHELYIERLKIDPACLKAVPLRRLQMINPVVEQNPEEWIHKAEQLSESDLINEVNVARGKPETQAEKKEKPESNPEDYGSYLKFVENSSCLTCGTRDPIQKAHIPKTLATGAPEWWVVPLCIECHAEYHQDPKEFIWHYREKIFNYFYSLISFAYKIAKSVGVKGYHG